MRLFVAVRPPDDVLDLVAGLRRPERANVRWTTRDQWHATVRFLGEVDDPAPVSAALDAAPLSPASAALGPRVAVLGRGVLVVPVDGLDDLAATVTGATRGFGRPPPDRPFRGHLTVGRARRGSVRGLAGEAVDTWFPVEDVRLVRSHLGPDGARYEDLHVRRLG